MMERFEEAYEMAKASHDYQAMADVALIIYTIELRKRNEEID